MQCLQKLISLFSFFIVSLILNIRCISKFVLPLVELKWFPVWPYTKTAFVLMQHIFASRWEKKCVTKEPQKKPLNTSINLLSTQGPHTLYILFIFIPIFDVFELIYIICIFDIVWISQVQGKLFKNWDLSFTHHC